MKLFAILLLLLFFSFLYTPQSFAKFSYDCEFRDPVNYLGEEPTSYIEAWQFKTIYCISEDIRVVASISAQTRPLRSARFEAEDFLFIGGYDYVFK